MSVVEQEGDARLERVIPSGNTTMVVRLDSDELRTFHGDEAVVSSGAVLVPPRDAATVVEFGGWRRLLIVNLRFAGASALTRVSLSSAGGKRIPLTDVLGFDVGEQVRAARDPVAAMADMLSATRTGVPDEAMRHAARLLDRCWRVAAVADEVGLSRKRFAARFAAVIGLTPKTFARVRRVQRVVDDVAASGAAPNWADTAVRSGYYDQAHLIGDFRRVVGHTPSTYASRPGRVGNHVPEDAFFQYTRPTTGAS